MTECASRPPLHLLGGGRSRPQETGPGEVGSKAFQLMRLDRLGLRVPPAVVVSTELCRRYHAEGGRLPEDFASELARGVSRLEEVAGARLGDRRRPLLVAVRSGAPVSMPGMMDTLLNVGLNDESVRGLVRATGDPHLAWDSYRRLVQAYAELHGAPAAPFRQALDEYLDDAAREPRELDAHALREVTKANLRLCAQLTGEPFPQQPLAQLRAAVEIVLRSWCSARAMAYRHLSGLSDDIGTAVMIQSMVFGNAGAQSGSGVGFTRDPATGERRLYVDFLFDAQGEDVVSGRHAVENASRLAARLPGVHAELVRVADVLERELGDMQDFEFTVQGGVLYLLQARNGKRTPWAALRIALDLVDEGIIGRAEALERLEQVDLDAIERVELAAPPGVAPVASATPASHGIAVGRIALDLKRARELAPGGPVLLVRESTSTEDIDGIALAEGILTRTGGRTSHAAVVARQLGKVCLVGCRALRIDLDARTLRIGDLGLTEGDVLTLDGQGGDVYASELPVRRERPRAALERVFAWRAGGSEREAGVPPGAGLALPPVDAREGDGMVMGW